MKSVKRQISSSSEEFRKKIFKTTYLLHIVINDDDLTFKLFDCLLTNTDEIILELV